MVEGPHRRVAGRGGGVDEATADESRGRSSRASSRAASPARLDGPPALPRRRRALRPGPRRRSATGAASSASRRTTVAERIEEGSGDRRTTDPASFAEALGEDVLARFVLCRRDPAARRRGPPGRRPPPRGSRRAVRGAPRRARRSATRSAGRCAATASRGADGARRVAAAVGEVVVRHAGSASRTFALEDWNVHLAPHVDRLDEDALHAEAREWLLSPALALVPPPRAAASGSRPCSAPECPNAPRRSRRRPPRRLGARLGDFDDAALRTAPGAPRRRRACSAARGSATGCPTSRSSCRATSLRDPADPRAAAGRARRRARGRASPSCVRRRAGLPGRGSRSLRVGPDEIAATPSATSSGDVTVATHACVNLAGAALRAGPGGVEACLADVDRLVDLALDAALARRRVPGAGRRGARRQPLGAASGARAAPRPRGRDPRRSSRWGSPSGRACSAATTRRLGRALAERLLARFDARAAEGARARDLAVAVVYGASTEAPCPLRARRCRPLRDATRRRPTMDAADVRARPSARDRRRGACPTASSLGPARSGGAAPARARIAVDADRRPSLDRLVEIVERAAADPAVVEVVVDPWPRRVRRTEA